VQVQPPADSFQDEPVTVVEVVSLQTRRIDEGEKKDAYLAVPSLEIYLLVEQNCPMALAYRQTDQGFVREIYQGIKATVPLACIQTNLALAEIYEGVEFVPEAEHSS
jgi:Uma2 family endonuclease